MTDLPAHTNHFNNYWPPDFGWSNGGSNDPESHSDQLVPLVVGGVSWGLTHKDAHGLWTALLTELLPHIEGGFRPGVCGCYNPRSIAASGTRSFHSWGIAIDVNWDVNPMGTYAYNPNLGKRGAIPNVIHEIAAKYGCEYGGNWSGGDGVTGFKDYMHIEIHLSPADARAIQPNTDSLEALVSLDPNSADYKRLVADIAQAVIDAPLTAKDGTKTTLGTAVVQGTVHSRDADHQTDDVADGKGGHK